MSIMLYRLGSSGNICLVKSGSRVPEEGMSEVKASQMMAGGSDISNGTDKLRSASTMVLGKDVVEIVLVCMLAYAFWTGARYGKHVSKAVH